jgi:hypothetical protein
MNTGIYATVSGTELKAQVQKMADDFKQRADAYSEIVSKIPDDEEQNAGYFLADHIDVNKTYFLNQNEVLNLKFGVL